MSFQSIQQELQNSLNQGKGAEALSLAKAFAAAGGTAPWMAIAKNCQQEGNFQAEEEALMLRLKEQRGDLLAISSLAELKRRQNDRRSATSFYRLGLNTIRQLKSPPQQVLVWAERAQTYLDEGVDVYFEHMSQHLQSKGIHLADTSPLMREAFDLLTGKTKVYLQDPNVFYFPGLPHRSWYERDEFEWAQEVEAFTDAITRELKEVLSAPEVFEPYVQAQVGRPAPNNPLLDDPSWGAGYIWKSGDLQSSLAEKVPSAVEALAIPDMPVIPERSPTAIFSRLTPDTHIAPHNGMINTRLICHLPLIVPEGCGIRVGATTRHWEPGKLLIFDDSIEHEAWNRGDSDRTILLFEVWRPEISVEDREVLSVLFEAINAFDGHA